MSVGFVKDHEDCNFCSMLRLAIAGLDTMAPALALAPQIRRMDTLLIGQMSSQYKRSEQEQDQKDLSNLP